jgi:hypothetical protein
MVEATLSSCLPPGFDTKIPSISDSAGAVCTIAGPTVSFIDVGSCVIDANQAGNANYNAASQVQVSFVVSQNNQIISFTSTAPGARRNVEARSHASGAWQTNSTKRPSGSRK